MPPRWTRDGFEAPGARAIARRKGHTIEKLTAEFDTTREAEREAMIQYLLRPLEVLRGNVRGPEDKTPANDSTVVAATPEVYEHLLALNPANALADWDMEVDEGWRITTTIANHHRGLNPRINMFSATFSSEEKSVGQSVHKQNE